jgi:RNA polymerase sigma-70 factor, ECF subfamily
MFSSFMGGCVSGLWNFQTKKSRFSALRADKHAHKPMAKEPTPDEWRSWLRDNGPRFLLFARQQTRTDSDAEDILQDALVESWQRAGRMPDDALVFATIRRRAIDLARSADRRAVREENSGPSEPWFAPDVEQRETQRLMEEAVKQITPIYRDVVVLKMWGGLTFQQIADTLGVPMNTAASRYRYAIEELRETLKGVLL